MPVMTEYPTKKNPIDSHKIADQPHDVSRPSRETWVIDLTRESGVSRYSTSLPKRASDLVLGSIGLLITAAITIVVGPTIWLMSPGPVFFRQQRVGVNGKVFTLVKFRTMRVPASGEDWNLRTAERDIRITKLGKLLRRSYIDELPQFWNVVKGDMSVVGPRPELPELERQLSNTNDAFRDRIKVKPGITGLAQVKYRHAHGEREAMRRIKFDRLYVEISSPLLDVKIVIQTILKALRQRGT